MPLPVLAVFSAVLSKVAAYGFLRVVTPLFPEASADFQTLMLLIALASILYGSVMAFTTTETRLILGYSSVAQLGFITLGIFALDGDGAQGAILQSVNHGIVVVPAFFIVGLLAARAGGSQDLRDMGGTAFRAPILAALFLIVALATLAMPGSANFVGEFMILLGVFRDNVVIALLAFTGVVLASVYMLRMFIRAMHNRVGPAVETAAGAPTGPRDLRFADGLGARAARSCAIIALSLYPQLPLKKGEGDINARSPRRSRPTARRWRSDEGPRHRLGGVLTPARRPRRRDRRAARGPAARAPRARDARADPGHRHARRLHGAVDLAVGRERLDPLGRPARRHVRDVPQPAVRRGGIVTVLLSWRALAPRESAHGEYYALLLTSIGGMAVSSPRRTRSRCSSASSCCRSRCTSSARPRCAARLARVGLKYLVIGSVGSADARLRPGAALRRDRARPDFAAWRARSPRRTSSATRCCSAASRSSWSAWPSRPPVAPFHQWTPDVYEGAPTAVTAFMAVGHQGRRVRHLLRLFDVALLDAQLTWGATLAVLATITIIVGNVGALGQSSLKRLLAWSSVAQAGYLLAGVVVGTRLGIEATPAVPRRVPRS
jgi:NADH:ubiquinone oxidoreductase subunit 4 (subunit M)